MKKILLLAFIFYLIWQMFFLFPEEKLQIVLCDVGQGDAILLSYGFFQVLIDTGPDEKVVSCLDQQLPFYDHRLEILILTHFDDDHIGGLGKLLDFYQIQTVFLPLTDQKDSKAFLELSEKLLREQEGRTALKQPFLGQQVAFSNSPLGNSSEELSFQAKYNSMPPLLLTFLTPESLPEENLAATQEFILNSFAKPEERLSASQWEDMRVKKSDNDRSIVVLLQFGELDFLLTGDLESTRELALVTAKLTTEVDVLKVGHHGSKTSSSQSFLRALRPEIALISVGENNSFGHPAKETLSSFNSLGTKVWRTDLNGTVKLLSDGQQIWFKEQKTKLFSHFFINSTK